MNTKSLTILFSPDFTFTSRNIERIFKEVVLPENGVNTLYIDADMNYYTISKDEIRELYSKISKGFGSVTDDRSQAKVVIDEEKSTSYLLNKLEGLEFVFDPSNEPISVLQLIGWDLSKGALEEIRTIFADVRHTVHFLRSSHTAEAVPRNEESQHRLLVPEAVDPETEPFAIGIKSFNFLDETSTVPPVPDEASSADARLGDTGMLDDDRRSTSSNNGRESHYRHDGAASSRSYTDSAEPEKSSFSGSTRDSQTTTVLEYTSIEQLRAFDTTSDHHQPPFKPTLEGDRHHTDSNKSFSINAELHTPNIPSSLPLLSIDTAGSEKESPETLKHDITTSVPHVSYYGVSTNDELSLDKAKVLYLETQLRQLDPESQSLLVPTVHFNDGDSKLEVFTYSGGIIVRVSEHNIVKDNFFSSASTSPSDGPQVLSVTASSESASAYLNGVALPPLETEGATPSADSSTHTESTLQWLRLHDHVPTPQQISESAISYSSDYEQLQVARQAVGDQPPVQYVVTSYSSEDEINDIVYPHITVRIHGGKQLEESVTELASESLHYFYKASYPASDTELRYDEDNVNDVPEDKFQVTTDTLVLYDLLETDVDISDDEDASGN